MRRSIVFRNTKKRFGTGLSEMMENRYQYQSKTTDLLYYVDHIELRTSISRPPFRISVEGNIIDDD